MSFIGYLKLKELFGQPNRNWLIIFCSIWKWDACRYHGSNLPMSIILSLKLLCCWPHTALALIRVREQSPKQFFVSDQSVNCICQGPRFNSYLSRNHIVTGYVKWSVSSNLDSCLNFITQRKMSESAAVEKYRTGNQEAWVLIARLRWTLWITP